jgi:hypothetical protein
MRGKPLVQLGGGNVHELLPESLKEVKKGFNSSLIRNFKCSQSHSFKYHVGASLKT